tara:strand:+ start:91 stop:834 length:744 start_codon:yes stop_codon:yes gene_type:complete
MADSYYSDLEEQESQDAQKQRSRGGPAEFLQGRASAEKAYGDMFSEGDIAGATKRAYADSLDGGGMFRTEDIEAQLRSQYGLEGDKLFDYATRLSDVAQGRTKTAGQVRAERALEILTGAQRGRARSQTGFDTATALRQGARAAQQAEATGEEQIGAAAELAQQQASADLEQLLIAGEQRAQDKSFAMAQLQQQQQAAEGAMFGNVLSGILGAVGAIAGGSLGGPAGAAAGAQGGSALGQGIGRWMA